MGSFLKKKIITHLAPVLTTLQLDRLWQPLLGGQGHILMFHRIVPNSEQWRIHNHLSLEISPAQLEATILYFKKKSYTFLSLDELYIALQTGQFPSKFVVFTFDDGYLDNYEVAYPILRQHRVPFTIFISTCFPDQRVVLWWYQLEEVLLQNEKLAFEWRGVHYQYHCQTILQKEQVFDKTRQLIHQFASDPQLLMTIFQCSQEQLYTYAQHQTMTWEQINAINQDDLVTIGAHTVNHLPLSQLTVADMKNEILSSKTQIESKIKQTVFHFSYPFGKKEQAGDREFNYLKSLPFKTAVTTRIGNIFKQHQAHTECLPRININQVTKGAVLDIQTSGLLPTLLNKGHRLVHR